MSTPTPVNCSGLANSGVPAKAPGIEAAVSDCDSPTIFANPKSMIFAVRPSPSKLTMILLGLMSRCTRFCLFRTQTGGHLGHDFECLLHLKLAGMPYELVQRLSIYILHRVEVTVATLPEVKYGSNVGVTHTGCRASLSYKTPASRFVANEAGVNHFPRYSTPNIDIDCLIGHSHPPVPKLERYSIWVLQNPEMFETKP